MISGGKDQADNGVIEKYCYEDTASNCDIYGGLYSWDEMMQYSYTEGGQGICPQGWHIPTSAEYNALSDFLGGENVSGGKMKETGTAHWNSPNTGATNSSGFTALPGGNHWGSAGYDYAFTDMRNLIYLSTSTTTGSDPTRAFCILLRCDGADIDLTSDVPKNTFNAFSVRCIKN
jgi:uncharacterized protein (TIGR02145 family)